MSSLLVPIVLGMALGLSVLGIALALTAPHLLPKAVSEAVLERRETLILGAGGTTLAIFVGLAISHLSP